MLKTTTTMMMIMSEMANKSGNEIVYFSGTKMNGMPYCDEAAAWNIWSLHKYLSSNFRQAVATRYHEIPAVNCLLDQQEEHKTEKSQQEISCRIKPSGSSSIA
jgi:hypothetical protein